MKKMWVAEAEVESGKWKPLLIKKKLIKSMEKSINVFVRTNYLLFCYCRNRAETLNYCFCVSKKKF